MGILTDGTGIANVACERGVITVHDSERGEPLAAGYELRTGDGSVTAARATTRRARAQCCADLAPRR